MLWNRNSSGFVVTVVTGNKHKAVVVATRGIIFVIVGALSECGEILRVK